MLLNFIPLKKYSNYKIGGNASYFYEFKTQEELIAALSEFAQVVKNGKILILGKGTNVLFSDDGFDGMVLKNSLDFIEREGLFINAGSGTLMDTLVSYCCQNALSGLEWAGGLPGTVGGAIRGNAGAFMGETKDNIESVESLDIHSLKLIRRNRRECNFGYRQSIFKNGSGKDEIILSVKFKLKKGNIKEIKKLTQEKIDYRIDRHPLDLPNIGSIFKNVPVEKVSPEVRKEFEKSIKQDPFPVVPAAKLIVSSGLMGKKIGGAQISLKHPNFIVNFNNAKARDVLSLIDLVKKEVKKKFDIDLEEEVMIA